tara:strand:- start:4 stop:186 length:183 start_codon:yes stop_codon:yes gene_type:complete
MENENAITLREAIKRTSKDETYKNRLTKEIEGHKVKLGDLEKELPVFKAGYDILLNQINN